MVAGESRAPHGPPGPDRPTHFNLLAVCDRASRGERISTAQTSTGQPAYRRAKAGIGRTFQHPHLLDRCDVLTNIIMGSDMAARKRTGAKPELERELPEILACAGLEHIRLHDPVSKLSYGQQKLLEVVRVLLSHPDILLLDEPAAGLNNRETQYVRV